MKQIKTFSTIAIASLMLMSFTPASIQQNVAVETNNTRAIKVLWEKDSHDFGDIPQGKPVSITFTFTNNGDELLLIADVVTSCGCTASDYTKEPIMPGKSSVIKVTYNAANKGAFTKSITVNTNDPAGAKILTIKGSVK